MSTTDDDAHREEAEGTETASGTSAVKVVERIVVAIGGIVVAIVVLRLVATLIGFSREGIIASAIYDISSPLVAPFFGMFNFEPVYGSSQFEFATLAAAVVYAIVFLGVAKLIARKGTV